MTPEQKRIAIAEACGWAECEPCKKNGYRMFRIPTGDGCQSQPPDYFNDLNAMHEAEKVLLNSGKDGIWSTYLYWLEVVCDVPMHHATAAQRAEAFGRTLNLWSNE